MRPVVLLPLLAALALVSLAPPSGAVSVIGGRDASQPYPWMGALRDAGDQFCGASLIAPEYALTAAHCVPDGKPENLTVLFNQAKLSGTGGEVIEVASVVVHPDYTDVTEGDDIAILKLATASAQTPIRIAGRGESALWEPGDTQRVLGWGASVYLVGPGYDDLQEVDVPRVSDGDCEASYPEFDIRTMVCAGETGGGKDSCQGDSGGPMFAFDAGGTPFQTGTVSYGTGCGFPGGFYGVYGRVADAPLRDWIASQVPNLDAAAPVATPVPTATPTLTPAPAAPTTPAPAPAVTRLRFARSIGSARTIRRRRSARLRVVSTGPIRDLTVSVAPRSGHRRALARGRRSRLEGRGTVTLRFTRAARPRAGRLRVSLRGRDAAGRLVRASGVVALRR